MPKRPQRPKPLSARERRRRLVVERIVREIVDFAGSEEAYWRAQHQRSHGLSRTTYERSFRRLWNGEPAFKDLGGPGARAIVPEARRFLPKAPPPPRAANIAYRLFAARCKLASVQACSQRTFRLWLCARFPSCRRALASARERSKARRRTTDL